MAITKLTDCDGFFTGNFPDIKFRSTTQENILVVVRIVNVEIDQEILRETYSPDGDGFFYLRDLGKVIQNQPFSNVADVTVKTAYAGSANTIALQFSFQIAYCKLAMENNFKDYFASSFLSSLKGYKVIYPDSVEHLYCMSTVNRGRRNINVKFTIRNKTTGEKRTITTVSSLTIGAYSAGGYSFSVQGIESGYPGHELLDITITVDERTQHFIVDRENIPALNLIFKNSFGQLETLSFNGIIERENKYEFLTRFFNGKFKNQHIDLTRKHTIKTGVLPRNMALWMEELFISDQIRLFVNGQAANEITILEAKVLRNSSRSELPAFEFSYRLSQSNQNLFETEEGGNITISPLDPIFDEVRFFDEFFDDYFG